MGLGFDPDDARALGDQIGQHLRAAVDRIAGPGLRVEVDLWVGTTKVAGSVIVKTLEEEK